MSKVNFVLLVVLALSASLIQDNEAGHHHGSDIIILGGHGHDHGYHMPSEFCSSSLF